MRRRHALAGAVACLGGLIALSLAVPNDPWEEFYAENYVSKFARSGVTAISDLITRGVMESDATVNERLAVGAADTPCTVHKPPHIVMVFDESSFDARALPGVKCRPATARISAPIDGKQRALMVEGAGGPSWYTEYNVLTGLSARSYGRFADFVTRIAAGRVERGLPHALRRCGYKTFTFYPMYGAFLGARHFQQTRRHPELPRFRGAAARTSSIRTHSISTRRPTRSRRSAATARCSCWSTRRRTISRGTSASVPTSRRTGATSATAPTSTNICAAST